MILYCATTNAGKIREIRRAAQGLLEIEPLPGLGGVPAPAETGVTFEENAVQKALYYAQFTPGWIFAEDSGIEVTALGGAPGVYSARFAGADATDAANNELLMERMRGEANRRARYVSAIALAHAGQIVRTFAGTVEGTLTGAPRGTGGFGYDPYFFYAPFGCTFGEAPLEDKMKVSHRARALELLFTWLGDNAAR
jgi:XTP/dITP diphosphohydrolase